jgi:tRNA (uracil-5-)-methyltransferase TRM9
MNPQTIAALNRINRRFYQHHGEDFSRTRRAAWPGWDRVLATLGVRETAAVSSHRLSILDVGCGNGRFLRFLDSRIRGGMVYLGVDSSLTLLDEARKAAAVQPGNESTLVMSDLTDEWALGCLRLEQFDLAVAFGLLHHMPGFRTRHRLLIDLTKLLKPGGLLAVSFWQLGEQQRFLRRAIAWDDYNRMAAEPVDVAEIEGGDLLLGWGNLVSEPYAEPGAVVRYCHFTDPQEAEALLAGLSLDPVTRYFADGEGGSQNLYHLLRRV